MIPNFTPNSTYKVAEVFFAERFLELVFYKTIDSYRAKLNNPRWILFELKQVISDWHSSKIKDFDKIVKPISTEALRFLDVENELAFLSIEKSFFKKLLSEVKKDKYNQLANAISLILNENKIYCENLFDAVDTEIKRLNILSENTEIGVDEFITLNRLTSYLATDLINLSYNKSYLYKCAWSGFKNDSAIPFWEMFNNLCSLSTREEEEYNIIFKLIKTSRETEITFENEVTREQQNEFSNLNDISRSFFSNKRGNAIFLNIKCKAKDYFSVVQKAKKELSKILDIIHLGFPDCNFSQQDKCLVIGTIEPSKASTRKISITIDNKFKNENNLYLKHRQTISSIEENNMISQESKQKISSAIRYLRLGKESTELEQKFINYWIGLEFIFSDYTVGESTIARLKENFVNIHTLIYIKRNILEFKEDLKRKRLTTYHGRFNIDDIENVYTEIINNESALNPLIAFRASQLKKYHNDSERAKLINSHRENLAWHLTRAYRIRNEIVHDAAIHLNIESITGHLKYYLTFALNCILDFFVNSPIDSNMDGKITIEDYFIIQNIKLESITDSKYKLSNLMEMNNVTEDFI